MMIQRKEWWVGSCSVQLMIMDCSMELVLRSVHDMSYEFYIRQQTIIRRIYLFHHFLHGFVQILCAGVTEQTQMAILNMFKPGTIDDMMIWSAAIMRDDDTVQCRHQSRLAEAVERASPLPLRTHPVHISETRISPLRQHPLRVVVLLIPNHSRQIDVHHVQHLLTPRTPGVLKGTAPRLSNEGRDGQVGSESVLEDTAVDFVILEDGLDAIAHCRLQIVVLELVGRGGEDALGQFEQALRGSRVGDSGLIDERPGDDKMGGYVVQFPQSQTHAYQVLSVYIFGRSDGGVDFVVHEGRVLGDGVRNEHALSCRNVETHEALGVGSRRASLS